MHFTIFFVVFSLESLIDNESLLELESEEFHYILRTSWTPDCFASRKVKLLKIIETDRVINITRACTGIFPKTDTKNRHFLPTKDRPTFQYKRDYNILLFQKTTNHLFKLQDCIQTSKIGKGSFDHGNICNFADL